MTLKNEEKDKRSRLYLFIIIIALFLINGVLIFNLINNEKKLTQAEETNEDLTEEVTKLESDLDQMSLQLEDYQGKNRQLDSIIVERNKEVDNKIAQIRAMLRDKNISKAQVKKLQDEIALLQTRINSYEHQIDSLSKMTEFLEDEVYARDQQIKDQQQKQEELFTELAAANEKVRIGSILKVDFIQAAAVKTKGTNKEKEVNRLSRADKIRVWFRLAKNDVAEKGTRTAYLKIITPSKSPLHNEERGSGQFTFQGEESLYTAKQSFNFRNEGEEITFYWDKSPAMIPGDYEAYIFCDDAIIGKAGFNLK
ncbi:MAG: hypothetical protein H6608_10290 [Flavobacteriales bacterium]|nr:hypothetical protein [Flavobacteriales bacterium]